ncbi:hypothetical protein CGZ75_22675 [Paenibacillus herberti]|uniref:Uncharacterized protein n=1 Tax=Paenibacillus herberti TaxID=1619309 RepID=A0A229NSY2_9BACL|nr:hypothetical protein CGZ75_22675 [Paenibacillus herberti]
MELRGGGPCRYCSKERLKTALRIGDVFCYVRACSGKGLLCSSLLYHGRVVHGLVVHGLVVHGLVVHGLVVHGLVRQFLVRSQQG